MSSTEQNSESEQSPSALQIGLVAAGIFVLLYSFLILARPLLGVAVVVWLAGLYLLWQFFHLASQFVRAVERIADALEARNGEV